MPTLLSRSPATTPIAGTDVLYIVQDPGGTPTEGQLTADDVTAGRVIPAAGVLVTGSTIPTNGLYLPAANTVGLATNGVLRVSVSTTLVTLASGMGLTLTDGDVTLSEGKLTITDTTNEAALVITTGAIGADAVRIIADSLAGGSAFTVFSTSTSSTARSLVVFDNNSGSATGCTVLELQQAAAQGFINYAGPAGATTTDPISTLTTSGATTHHLQIDINGTKAWIAASTNNPS